MLTAAFAALVVSCILAFLAITLRASQIVSGLALTIFCGGLGLASYLGNDLGLADLPPKHQFSDIDVFGLEDVPVVGPVLFHQSALVYFSWVLVALIALLPDAHADRAERARDRRGAGRGRRDGDQRRRGTGTRTCSPAARSPGSAARATAWRSRPAGRTATRSSAARAGSRSRS